MGGHQPMLPNKAQGVRRVDDRRVLAAIRRTISHHPLQPFRLVVKGRSVGADHGRTCRRS
jgi:hypothetical protein